MKVTTPVKFIAVVFALAVLLPLGVSMATEGTLFANVTQIFWNSVGLGLFVFFMRRDRCQQRQKRDNEAG